jgi:putative ABC transport system substrate-binding protein
MTLIKGEFEMKFNKQQMLVVTLFIVAGLLLAACGAAQPETFTIGVVNYVPNLNPVLDGLKSGMADLDYVEDENVTYLYNGPVEPTNEAVDQEIQSMIAQDVDLLVTVGSLPAVRAKQIVEGTDMPVVFAPVANLVAAQTLVDDLRQPGGNLTGVVNGNSAPKALERLVNLVPEATKVYVPYNPANQVSADMLGTISEVATEMGVEIIPGEVASIEEAVTAIESLPDDVDAIFILPSPTLAPGYPTIAEAAIEQNLPLGASVNIQNALFNYAFDFFTAGEQAARLAGQILQGGNPAELPVEVAEFYLSINLQTAEAIGLDIPDDVLRQTDTVIR